MPVVNPAILTWAREKAGYSLEDAARKIELKAAKGKMGAERLEALERGEESPSRSLLQRMSKKYHRSLLVFYLDKPPRLGSRGKDFRIAPGAEPPEYDPTVDALIRDVYMRHNLVKSLLEDEESPQISFIGAMNIDQGSDSVANSIIETLGFHIDEYRGQKSAGEAFVYLRSKIESAGVYLLLISNLGSHHTSVPSSVFRGFAIADPVAPFIVVNDQDAKAAWSFTSLHEMVHLWLGVSGISGASLEGQIEQFCNEVAARILLRHQEIQALSDIKFSSFDNMIVRISDFSEELKISRKMVTYSLFRAGIIDREVYNVLSIHFFNEWLQIKRRLREIRKPEDRGPSYYIVKKHRLGRALVNLVDRSIGDGNITYTKAGQILGVKPRNVEHLLGRRKLGGER